MERNITTRLHGVRLVALLSNRKYGISRIVHLVSIATSVEASCEPGFLIDMVQEIILCGNQHLLLPQCSDKNCYLVSKILHTAPAELVAASLSVHSCRCCCIDDHKHTVRAVHIVHQRKSYPRPVFCYYHHLAEDMTEYALHRGPEATSMVCVFAPPPMLSQW